MNSSVSLTKIRAHRAEAERKAWDSLSRYKFLMFGYHAAGWVKYNRLDNDPAPNPFRALVRKARSEQKSITDKQLQFELTAKGVS